MAFCFCCKINLRSTLILALWLSVLLLIDLERDRWSEVDEDFDALLFCEDEEEDEDSERRRRYLLNKLN